MIVSRNVNVLNFEVQPIVHTVEGGNSTLSSYRLILVAFFIVNLKYYDE